MIINWRRYAVERSFNLSMRAMKWVKNNKKNKKIISIYLNT